MSGTETEIAQENTSSGLQSDPWPADKCDELFQAFFLFIF